MSHYLYKCSRCEELKEEGDFNKDRSSSTGYRTTCRTCDHKRYKAWKRKRKPLKVGHIRITGETKSVDLRKKEQLIAENATLALQIEVIKKQDKDMRDTLSELLEQYVPASNPWGKTEEVKDCSWYRIAYLIGELKADADFSITIEAREELKRENQMLKERIRILENPPNKA